MILSSPAPQFGQRCISISKIRLSSRAQLMRPGPTWAVPASHWTPDAATPAASSWYALAAVTQWARPADVVAEVPKAMTCANSVLPTFMAHLCHIVDAEAAVAMTDRAGGVDSAEAPPGDRQDILHRPV